MDTSEIRLKYLENFEMQSLRKMEKIILYDRVRNEVVLYRDNGDWCILHTININRPLDWSHFVYELPCKTYF